MADGKIVLTSSPANQLIELRCVPQLQNFLLVCKPTTLSPEFKFGEFSMSSTYGSDNPDCVRVDHLGEVAPARSKWKKAVLVTAGAALCLGGALVMYEGWNAPFSATVTSSTIPLTEMNLESAAMSTDQANLMSGLPVLLRVKGKANLCADDGGATKADTTYITNQPCNPSNPNQLFIYDSIKSQFKSAKKENLCIDTGGGLAGLTWLRLSKCSTKKNDDQIFTYDPSTLMVSVSKNTCMTDGGGDEAGDSHYTIWGCSTKNANMRFEVLSQSALAAEQKTILDAVAGGAKFLLRIAGKAGLCASGSGTTAASTSFTPAVCDKQTKDQLFSYDASINRIRSSEKKGLCLDDGGAKKAKVDLRLANCSAASADQTFAYDPTTLMFSQPNKAKLCVDDGTSFWFKAPRLVLKDCDPYSKDQHFEYVLQTDPVTTATATAPTTTTTTTATSVIDTPVATTAPHVAADTTTTSSTQVSATSTIQQPSVTTAYETPATSNTPSQPETPTAYQQESTESTTAPQASQYATVSATESSTASTENTHFTTTTTGVALPQVNQMTSTTSTTDPGTTMSKENDMMTSATQPGTTMSKENDMMTTPAMDPGTTMRKENDMKTTSATQPGTAMSKENDMMTTSATQPSTTMSKENDMKTTSAMEPDSTMSKENDMMTTSATQPSTTMSKENDMKTTSAMEPDSTMSKENDMMTTSATQPSTTMSKENDMKTTSAMEPDSTMSKENDMMTTSATQPSTTMSKENDMKTTSAMEPDSTMSKENDMMTTSATQPSTTMSKENDMKTTSAMEPDSTMSKENDMMTTSATQPGTTMSKENDMMATSAMDPGATTSKKNDMMTTSAMEPGMTTPDVGEMVDKLTVADQDWNLLAPSENTLARVDWDNTPVVPVANIFQYLQSLKDRADLEHQEVMYRYKRTFECATAGLQTLVKDSVTAEEFKVLVRWMYEHCAAGYTDIETPAMPSLPNSAIDSADVAPLVNDPKTDVQRQFMTKLDFYYEIKNYFAETSEKLNGEMAAAHLRTGETKELETKMLDCIDEASERFGFKANAQAYATTEHLKAAIAWVEDSCMKP